MDYLKLTDAELMAHYKNGDNRALELLLSRHRKFFFNIINSNIRNYSIAEDILQNSYLSVIEAIKNGSFKEPFYFKSYMATTCKNNTINYLRKSSTKIQANSVSYEHGEYEYDTTPVSPEDRFIQNETVAFVLDKAIPNLNEQLQDPILLRMQGYKYSEISEILGLKLGTVKSRIFFARRDLIPYFNSHGFSPD